jgi:glutamine amidotransferase
MNRLNELGLADALREIARSGEVAMLGVCLGAQLLLEGSEEAAEPGLGIIPGRCRKFEREALPPELRIPHMGWTEVIARNPEHPLAMGQDDERRFYFVHSFRMMPEQAEHVLFMAQHGIEFCAGVASGHVVGVQFHPEKSHRFGMHFLKSFANWEIR